MQDCTDIPTQTQTQTHIQTKNILVISGGGTKGLCALGALTHLYESNIIVQPKIYAGTSVGAVICFLLTIGYKPSEMYEVLEQIDFTKLIHMLEPENILINPCFGFGSPKPIMKMIGFFVKKKNISETITFKELFDMTNAKLIITGTCLNDSSLKYFSVDTTPNMSIMKALRISISIPFLFTPCTYDGKIWVDGGCMNNFPIDIFTENLDDVIGVYLDDEYESIEKITDVQEYFFRMFKCVYRGMNYNKIELYKKYFVHVVVSGYQGLNWNMGSDEKKVLYDVGYACAQNYVMGNV